MGRARNLVFAALVAVGSAAVNAAPPPVAWQGTTEIAVGRAEQGPWRQNESRYDYVDDATVAIDGTGGIAVAWVDQKHKAVLLQRYSAAGTPQLAQPTDVSRQPDTFSWLPRLAFAPAAPRQLYAAWQEIVFTPGGSHGGEILFARSDDGGRSFLPPVNLSRSKGGDGKGRINRDVWHNGSFDLVAGPGGVIHAAWTEYDGALWHSRSADGGRTFTPPRLVAGDDRRPARAPSLALGRGGTVYLAWTVGEEGADIHLSASTDHGASFAAPRVVAPSLGYSDAPKLAVDGAGVLHLAYAESPDGPFGRAHVRHARSSDGGRTFDPPRDISAPMPPGAVSASYPSLAADGRGHVLVTWELARAARQQPRGLAVVVSKDGGGRFSPPALVPDSADPRGGFNGSRQGLLMKKLAVSEQGAVAIVNSSFQAGGRSRVWLVRGVLRR